MDYFFFLWSSRAQARTTLEQEFPIRTLSVVRRVPSSSMVHVSCAPSKIPYVGFSPVRLQAKAYQQYPAQRAPSVKCQIHIPPDASWFDTAFVNHVPSCLHGRHYQPTGLSSPLLTTLAHGPFAPAGLCCPSPLCYYDPIRGSLPLPLISQFAGYTKGPCPTIWYGLP